MHYRQRDRGEVKDKALIAETLKWKFAIKMICFRLWNKIYIINILNDIIKKKRYKNVILFKWITIYFKRNVYVLPFGVKNILYKLQILTS